MASGDGTQRPKPPARVSVSPTPASISHEMAQKSSDGDERVRVPQRPDALRRLRLAHQESVVAELRRAGTLTRAELVERTSLPRTTLFDTVSALLAAGVIVEAQGDADTPRRRGRPVVPVALNPASGLVVGVEVALAGVRTAIANVAHEVVATATQPLPAGTAWPECARAAATLVRQAATKHQIRLDTLEAIGLGMTGLIQDPMADPGSGMRMHAAEGIVHYLEDEFGVPVLAENNTRLAALAEVTWGTARNCRNAVYVRWSYGVGGSLVVDGRLVRGEHGAAGEIGHTSLDPAGEPCYCGGRGCLEQQIRPDALISQCAAAGTDVANLDGLLTRATGHDPSVRAVLTKAAHTLGRVLANLAAHLDPELIIVGGELAQLDALVLDPVRDAISTLVLPSYPRQLRVVPAELHEQGATLGGIALALRTHEPLPEIRLHGVTPEPRP